ncbi:MAG TPA: SRPBCC family protein [Nocardioides sp.]|jgi:uncharacterized membrane protein
MKFESGTTIAAAPGRVWEVFADVERWPEWTESIDSVELLDPADRGAPLRVGVRAKVRQPKLPAAVWEVTEVVDGESFTWVSRSPGVRTTGVHAVSADGHGARATNSVEQSGPLGWLAGALTARLTRRYLAVELAGLKRRCESPE